MHYNKCRSLDRSIESYKDRYRYCISLNLSSISDRQPRNILATSRHISQLSSPLLHLKQHRHSIRSKFVILMSGSSDPPAVSHKGKAKTFFDKAWSAADKYIGEPSNKLAGKVGMESFWPTTMERELDKAARILRVFTLDGGVQTTENVADESGHKKKQKVIKKIPQDVIANAKGLAIFTVLSSRRQAPFVSHADV